MRRKIVISALAAGALGLSACGGYGSDNSEASADTTASTTVDGSTDESNGGTSDDNASQGSSIVGVASTELGDVLSDADGFTLYGLTDDVDGIPTCDDDCAEAWPPLLTDGAELPAGLDPNLFSVVERSDGSQQLRAGAFPLYRFAGDTAPGDTNGQGVGGVWFAVDPSGQLIGADTASAEATGGSGSEDNSSDQSPDDGYGDGGS